MAAARAGDTVDVAPGEYSSRCSWQERSHSRAAGCRARRCCAPLPSVPALRWSAENVKDVRFSGFRILAAKDLPIAIGILLDNSRVEVDDVEVDGRGRRGGDPRRESPALRANSIHDCGSEGVLILGESKPWISHNDIRPQ